MTTRSWIRRLFARTPCRHAARKAKPQRAVIPAVEHLEDRITPAVPTITGVFLSGTPLPYGSILTATPPALKVTFSEPMSTTDNNKSLTNVNNYELLDATGKPVALLSSGAGAPTVSAGPTGPNEAVTLTVANTNLPAKAYTLYVRADQLFDADENQPIAQAGQLVAANSGRGNISTFAMPGNGSLGAVSNYPGPTVAATPSSPTAVAVADLDGSGIPDLIVASGTTNTVTIFAGQSTGGFNQSPAAVLALPSGANPSGIVAADFNGDGKLDLAVTDKGANQISVFLNTSTGRGDFVFGAATNLGAGASPVGLVTADFKGDMNADLAVADSAVDGNSNFNVTILEGDGNGNFPTTVTVTVGTGGKSPSKLQTPTGLAVGHFHGSSLPDLAVSGEGGISVATNSANTFTPTFIAGSDSTSIATGLFHANATGGPNQDDILTTTFGGQLQPYVNNGTGNFSAAGQYSTPATNPTAVAFRDGNGDGKPETIFANNVANGTVNVLPTQQAGLITSATGAAGTVTVTSPNHGLRNGQVVSIAGNSVANGIFFITNVTANTFDLLGSGGNGTAVGGAWAAVPGVITALTNANAPGSQTGTITIPSPHHGLVTGSVVTISGVLGDTNANNMAQNPSWVVTVIDSDHFSLNGSNGNAAFVAGNNPNNPPRWSVSYLVDANPQALAFGDGNGDGVPDIVVANGSSQDASLLPGGSLTRSAAITNVTNAFSTFGTITITSSNHGLKNGQQVTITDVQGDTAANGTWTITNVTANTFDLVGSNGNGAYTTGGIWSANIADGRFLASVNLNVGPGTQPRGVVVGDLNGDGIPDLVVANAGSNSISVFLGLKGGGYAAPLTFSTLVNGVGHNPVSVAIGDLNRDGFPDIVTANSDNSVTIFQNSAANPGTSFTTSTASVGASPTQVVLADFGFANNGGLDIAVAHTGGGGASPSCSTRGMGRSRPGRRSPPASRPPSWPPRTSTTTQGRWTSPSPTPPARSPSSIQTPEATGSSRPSSPPRWAPTPPPWPRPTSTATATTTWSPSAVPRPRPRTSRSCSTRVAAASRPPSTPRYRLASPSPAWPSLTSTRTASRTWCLVRSPAASTTSTR
jgi:hypothetical protein